MAGCESVKALCDITKMQHFFSAQHCADFVNNMTLSYCWKQHFNGAEYSGDVEVSAVATQLAGCSFFFFFLCGIRMFLCV